MIFDRNDNRKIKSIIRYFDWIIYKYDFILKISKREKGEIEWT